MGDDKDKGGMAWHTKLAYGVGHFFNDLCASMWFTYLLIFFNQVLGFTGVQAGIILLVGQLADGLATPIVGMLCDTKINNKFIANYGRRKIWHLGGTILVAVTFPFIWQDAMGCSDADPALRMAYYCFFVILFQFGWAATQISHLALIPDLTTQKKQRTELNSLRYAFTVIANLSVYLIMFLVLDNDCELGGNSVGNGNFSTIYSTAMTGTTEEGCGGDLGPKDSDKFAITAYICLGIGLAFSLLFQLGVKEKPYTVSKRTESGKYKRRDSIKNGMKKIDWFKELPFYQVAVLYMATRLYVNLYQSYIVLYIQETLELPKDTVATVPFVMYAAGFIGSIFMKIINSKIGRKATFTLGCLVGLSACIWVGLDRSDEFLEWGIYLVASLLGIGGSTLLITSLSITADLIGDNIEGGAFVYGFMSLVDKVSNGIIIMIIQTIGDEQEPKGNFYQMVITYACGSACVLGIMVICTLIGRRINSRDNRRKSTLVNSTFDDNHDQQNGDSEGGIDNPACEDKDDTLAASAIKDCGVVDTPAAAITAVTKCTKDIDEEVEDIENGNPNEENENEDENKNETNKKNKEDVSVAMSAIKDCGLVDTPAAAITAVTKCTKDVEEESDSENESKNVTNNKNSKNTSVAASAIKDCGVVDTPAAAITAVTKCTKDIDEEVDDSGQNKIV